LVLKIILEKCTRLNSSCIFSSNVLWNHNMITWWILFWALQPLIHNFTFAFGIFNFRHGRGVHQKCTQSKMTGAVVKNLRVVSPGWRRALWRQPGHSRSYFTHRMSYTMNHQFRKTDTQLIQKVNVTLFWSYESPYRARNDPSCQDGHFEPKVDIVRSVLRNFFNQLSVLFFFWTRGVLRIIIRNTHR